MIEDGTTIKALESEFLGIKNVDLERDAISDPNYSFFSFICTYHLS